MLLFQDAASLCSHRAVCDTFTWFNVAKPLCCKSVRDTQGGAGLTVRLSVLGVNPKSVSPIVAASLANVESVANVLTDVESPTDAPEKEARELRAQEIAQALPNLDVTPAAPVVPSEPLRPLMDASADSDSSQEALNEPSGSKTREVSEKQGLVAGRKKKKVWTGPIRPKRSPPKPPWSKEFCDAKVTALVEALLLSDRESKVTIDCILDPWLGKVTRVDLSNVIRALEGRGKVLLALEVFNWMKNQKRRLKPNGQICSLVLGVLGRAGEVAKASEVFEFACSRSTNLVFIYNAMIGAYIQGGKYKNAWRLYQKMFSEGIVPDEVTSNTLIKASLHGSLPVEKAENLFARMKERGMKPSITTFNTLISALAKHGHHLRVQGFLEEMKLFHVQPDLVTFNTLINMYAKSGKDRKAISAFEALKASGLQPNVITFSGVIQALSEGGKHQEAMNVLHEMLEAGCRPDLKTYSLLLNVHGRAGLVAEAERVFEEMQKAGYKPNLIAWSSMIQAYTRKGSLDKAMSLLHQMESSGCTGDVSLFNILMGAHARAGMTASAAELFQKMQLAGVCPNGVTYSILIASYTRSGQQMKVRHVQDLMIRAGYDPNDLRKFKL